MRPTGPILDAAHPPSLDRASRRGAWPAAAILEHAAGFPPAMTDSRREVARGLLLLWHDHWEEAHAIAQDDEGEPDHDLLHALVHRREGDFDNARYWFRRAGSAESHALLPARVEPLLRGSALSASLLRSGAWNPVAFLDAVRRGGNEDLLRAVQAQEFLAFHETLLR